MPYKDPDRQREFQRKWMREFRKRKREERKILLKIQDFPEYKALSKVRQKEVDEAVVRMMAMIDERMKRLEEEIEVKVRTRMAELRKTILDALLEYHQLLKVRPQMIHKLGKENELELRTVMTNE